MSNAALREHQAALAACRRCPDMHRPPIVGQPVMSRVLLVGQAPGDKEPKLRRPFAWTAGKTLFKWFHEHCGLDEAAFREHIYIAAACRCFPGKRPRGGDRVPSREEVETCAPWLQAEFRLLQPELVIPVGRLAIARFMPYTAMAQCVGRAVDCEFAGHRFTAVPLPHPSGASPWPRVEPGKTLLRQAMTLIAEHAAMRSIRRQR